MRHMFRSLLAMALLAIAAPALAADSAARVSIGSQQVTWDPQIAHERTVLTVSTPSGKVERREFKGSSPSFELSTTAADGVYHWELQILPATSPRQRQAQAGAEALGARSQGTIVSGAFTVRGGQIVSPEQKEAGGRGVIQQSTPIARLDQVTPDDLIVQGSACVGLDCVVNESFGFDTIRLKENNTRIKFDDTSTGSFPANDWQLTANDSASGGSSKFSIEDITGSKVPFTITAGAATNSLFIDSASRMGLRTSTPVLDIHINTSNTPAIRMEQNSSGGFTAQTWDIAGNEANFFVRDVTGGSRLPFRIRPGAPTSSIDISASGNVGIGTASPSNSLHVSRSDGSAKLFVQESNGTTTDRELAEFRNNGGSNLILKDSSRSERWAFGVFQGNFILNEQVHAGVEMTLTSAGNVTFAGTVTPGSSRTIKQDFSNVQPSEVLRKVMAMPITSWAYRADPGVRHIGPMAEDFYSAFSVGTDDKGISVTDSAGVALAAIQGLQQELSSKDAEIASLKQRLAALEAAVATLTSH